MYGLEKITSSKRAYYEYVELYVLSALLVACGSRGWC
jgi:hypothetical protein